MAWNEKAKSKNVIAGLLKASMAISSMFFLAACGNDSGNNGKIEGLGDGTISALPHFESFDDLPNCSSTREDSVAVTKNNNVAYKCLDGRWETLGEPYETEDDLPNCSSTRDGQDAYVLDVDKKFVCSDGRWNAASKASSKESGKTSEEGKPTGSEETVGESSSVDGDSDGNSSSSKKDGEKEINSSSSKENGDAETVQSASSEQTTQTECGEVAYTTQTAGPHGFWGDFGYVLPLKVTTGKTQELYLAFQTTNTAINGPQEWSRFGALIAKYNSKDSLWVQGTEIFSKNTKDASPIFVDPNCGDCSTVNTYGLFEKFEFNVKGTWLEKYAGKTIDVVINFYSPDAGSDSSGMGFDYYAIPTNQTSSTYTTNSTGIREYPARLYYSEKETCTLYFKVTTSHYNQLPFECQVGNDKTFLEFDPSNGKATNYIYTGDTVVWRVAVSGIQLEDRAYEITMQKKWISDIGTKAKERNDSLFIYYPTPGETHDTIVLSLLGMQYDLPCPYEAYDQNRPTGISYVVSAVKNCVCTASTETPDATTAGNFTLSAKKCVSESPIVDYAFGHTICSQTTSGNTCKDYEFSNATSVSETSVSVNYAAGTRASYSPFVVVTNEDGISSRVTCPTIEVQPSSTSSSSSSISTTVFSPASSAITIPKGTWPVEFLLPENSYSCHASLGCTLSAYPAEGSEIEITLDGKTITDEVPSGSYKEIDLTGELVCPSSTAGTITVSNDISCHFTAY